MIKGNIEIFQSYGDEHKSLYTGSNMVVDGFRKTIADVMTYMPNPSGGVFRGIDNVCTVPNYSNGDRVQRCFIGIDTGLSNDYSVLTIMNEAGRVMFMDRIKGENINTIANKFIGIMSRFNIHGGYIETNGIGRAMYDLIMPKQRKLKGFTTTQDSKTQIVRTLIE